jgi:hypothetical protein
VIQQRRDEAACRARLDSREIAFSRSVVQLAARDQIWDGTVTPINTNLAPFRLVCKGRQYLPRRARWRAARRERL